MHIIVMSLGVTRFPRSALSAIMCVSNTSRTRCLTHYVSSLSKWHAAVAQIPLSTILPIGLGAVNNKANIAAFFGDQKFNMEVTLALQRISTMPNSPYKVDLGWLTQVKSEAVSNRMFAKNLGQILPDQSQGFVELAQLQPHDAGTFVEAAVEAVAISIPGGESGREAVAELAKWLVQEALKRGHANYNYKGDLLELGGTIETKRIGGMDHEPVFLAKANLFDHSAEAEGRNKKLAEQEASEKLFENVGI
jgi:dsRNA-specific ribonuclease